MKFTSFTTLNYQEVECDSNSLLSSPSQVAICYLVLPVRWLCRLENLPLTDQRIRADVPVSDSCLWAGKLGRKTDEPKPRLTA